MIKQKFTVKRLSLMLGLFIIMTSASYFYGCSDDNTTPIGPTVQNSYLSFIHASPDAPNVDVYVGGALAKANVGYLGTMNYLNFIAGSNRVQVYVTGTQVDPLIDSTVFLYLNQYYTLFAIDSLQNIQPLFTSDDLSTPGTGNCNARFLNLSPNSPSYDVQAVGKVQPWFPDYSFGDVSNFRALTFGVYDININLALTPTTVLAVPNVTLVQGKIYTMIVNGFVGATGNQALGFTIFTTN